MLLFLSLFCFLLKHFFSNLWLNKILLALEKVMVAGVKRFFSGLNIYLFIYLLALDDISISIFMSLKRLYYKNPFLDFCFRSYLLSFFFLALVLLS